ncbi:hypothetical protein H7F51_11080 [Novosphingobium flavum]|uniref:Uncharacterized protein n=1 Tax=Novosphingobium flavum TaxID=1778672 RepID=A0A7X1KM92_9SPHN|nr:hypothetical protein [Novosphingobium flavum]MBC2666060.1 hypothetical protein [Novosphingobium flavum]
MWQVLAFFAAVALLAAAFKLALFLIIIAGLIFKTKETVALLTLGGLMNAFAYAPVITTCALVALFAAGAYFKSKEKQKEEADAFEQTLRQLPAPADGKEL